MLTTVRLDANNTDDLSRASELLRQGKLVAVPTETVYGLAANAEDVDAVKEIFAAKNRPSDHPLIVHIADKDRIQHWAENIPELAFQLAEKFWPGPMTLLLKKADNINSVVTGKLDTIALRVPDHPMLLRLLKQSNIGLAAPSANPYRQLSPTSADQVMDNMQGKIDAVLDGGDCQLGLESTIVDVVSNPIRILRSGPITANEIETFLGQPVITPATHTESVPGNVKAHYQPRAKLTLCDKEKLFIALSNDNPKIGYIVYSDDFDKDQSEHIRHLPSDKYAFAKLLYKTLYEFDKVDIDEIWIERPPQTDEWQAINDRLARASAATDA